LWLRDIKDGIKGPHLDFFGGPTVFHTALRTRFYKYHVTDVETMCQTQYIMHMVN